MRTTRRSFPGSASSRCFRTSSWGGSPTASRPSPSKWASTSSPPHLQGRGFLLAPRRAGAHLPPGSRTGSYHQRVGGRGDVRGGGLHLQGGEGLLCSGNSGLEDRLPESLELLHTHPERA